MLPWARGHSWGKCRPSKVPGAPPCGWVCELIGPHPSPGPCQGWRVAEVAGLGRGAGSRDPPPRGRLATCMCHRPWQEGCGLLPATPTFHREGGPGTWCPHGLGARSYLKETSFREAPSRAQDVSAVSQSPSSPRASRAKGTPCTWASSEMP